MELSAPLTERERAEVLQLSVKYGLVKVFYDKGIGKRIVAIGTKPLRNFEASRLDLIFMSDGYRILHDRARISTPDKPALILRFCADSQTKNPLEQLREQIRSERLKGREISEIYVDKKTRRRLEIWAGLQSPDKEIDGAFGTFEGIRLVEKEC